MGPLVLAIVRFNAVMSSPSDVSGRGAATTCSPCLLRGRMTSLQLDPSAQAPWATTTVLFSGSGICCSFLLTSVLGVNRKSPEKFSDALRNKFARILQREVARVEETNRRSGNVTFERLGTARQKEGIVLSPHGQERWFVCPEVFLESWVECDVTLVVA